MNIKLHAKLAAYSKISEIKNEMELPEPTFSDIGGFVGVGVDGKYTIFKNVSQSRIDELFTEEGIEVNTTNKALIDSLF